MKKLTLNLFAILLAACLLSSCYANKFNVGDGAKGNEKHKQMNAYLFGGLVRVSQADPQTMAGGTKDYTVVVKHSFLDMFIGSLTFGIFTPTTTVVKK